MPGEAWVDPAGEYRRIEAIDEPSFEHLIDRFQGAVFGGRIFLPIKRRFRSRMGDTIPDGILIGPRDVDGWDFVEVETAEHDVNSHILPQLSRIGAIELSSVDVYALATDVAQELGKRKLLVGFSLAMLIKMLNRSPGLVLVIDEEGSRIRSMLQALRHPISLVVASPFRNERGEFGLLIQKRLRSPSETLVLAVPNPHGILGVNLLIATEGRELLPDSGEITLKAGDESAAGRIFDDGSHFGVSMNGEDLDRLVGGLEVGSKLICTPRLGFRIYRCEEVQNVAE